MRQLRFFPVFACIIVGILGCQEDGGGGLYTSDGDSEAILMGDTASVRPGLDTGPNEILNTATGPAARWGGYYCQLFALSNGVKHGV